MCIHHLGSARYNPKIFYFSNCLQKQTVHEQKDTVQTIVSEDSVRATSNNSIFEQFSFKELTCTYVSILERRKCMFHKWVLYGDI